MRGRAGATERERRSTGYADAHRSLAWWSGLPMGLPISVSCTQVIRSALRSNWGDSTCLRWPSVSQAGGAVACSSEACRPMRCCAHLADRIGWTGPFRDTLVPFYRCSNEAQTQVQHCSACVHSHSSNTFDPSLEYWTNILPHRVHLSSSISRLVHPLTMVFLPGIDFQRTGQKNQNCVLQFYFICILQY